MAKAKTKTKPKSKAKSKTKTKPAVAAKTVSDVHKLTNAKVLTGLLRRNAEAATKTASINGSLREDIAYAVEHNYLHKGAFAILKKFDRMEDVKLAELWPTLLAYMDMTGVTKKIEAVERLPLGDQTDGEAEPGEAEETDDAKPPRAGPALDPATETHGQA